MSQLRGTTALWLFRWQDESQGAIASEHMLWHGHMLSGSHAVCLVLRVAIFRGGMKLLQVGLRQREEGGVTRVNETSDHSQFSGVILLPPGTIAIHHEVTP